jgi:hypothetical protein
MRIASLAAMGVVALLGLALLFPAAAPAKDATARIGNQLFVINGFDPDSGTKVDNVLVVDSDVSLSNGTTVDGDLVAIAGDVWIAGAVEGNVTAVRGEVFLYPTARIDGDVVYGGDQPEIADAAVVGGEVRELGWWDYADVSWGVIGAAAAWLAVSLSLLVTGIVLVAILPGAAEAAQRTARSQLALSSAMGIAAVVGLLLLGALAVVTVVGVPLTIVVGLALLPLAWIGYLTCSFVVGRIVAGEGSPRLLAFLAGLAVLRAVALVPVVGLLTWIPAVFVGLGALIVAAMARGASSPPAPASGPVAG